MTISGGRSGESEGQELGATAATDGDAPAANSGAPAPPRCHWCRRVLPTKKGPGRRRKYCSQACRQWDWVSRQRAAELQLSEDELVMARSELERLHDDLYVLACAVEDTERDLRSSLTKSDLAEMLNWLLEAARPLRDRELSAPTRRAE